MLQGFSQTTLIGKVTDEPKMRQTQNGRDFCTFTLGVLPFPQAEEPEFFDAVAWGEAAKKVISVLGKGCFALFHGTFRARVYTPRGSETPQKAVTFQVNDPGGVIPLSDEPPAPESEVPDGFEEPPF